MMEKPKKTETNLDKVAKHRAALRKAIAMAGGDSTKVLQDIRAGNNPETSSLASLSGLKKTITSRIAGNLREIDTEAKELSLKGPDAFKKAKERVRADKAKNERTVLDEEALRREIGPVYDAFMNIEHDSDELRRMEMSWVHEKEPGARDELQKIAREAREDIQTRNREMHTNHPREYRAAWLTSYVDELHAEGHIAHTPTVNAYLQQIKQRMMTGKPIFLHGPTGTGKTSLARRAARGYTGHDAEMVYCNPQTRESNIWGKTGIRPAAGGAIETIDIFGPLARAMQEGKPVIFDEFTALPKEQMVFIKGVFNAKPGDTINVVGNGRIMIAPGFQMIFTANLKSEKNPERQELPPEIAREFEQNNLEILYNPPSEAYDIMLARLMHSDGSVHLSWHDVHTTLPKFCEALREIQIAYYDRESSDTARLTGTLEASGKSPALKKLVMTQGTVEAILEAWQVQKQMRGSDISFVQFLDQRLATGLTFKEYPESDRILAAKILASKGLLRTITPQQLGLPQDVFNFDAANNQRGNGDALKTLVEKSAKEQHISIMELADLDPFGVRKERKAEQFLTPEEQVAPLQRSAGGLVPKGPPDFVQVEKNTNAYLEKVFTAWYGTDAKKAKIKPFTYPGVSDYTARKNDIDKKKFGEYTLDATMQGLHLEHAKVFIPDLSSFKGQEVDVVMNHVATTYGATHRIPGIEYWKWIVDEEERAKQTGTPSAVPINLKDGNYYFFPGSVLRARDGNWNLPFAYWRGSEFDRHAYWLGNDWLPLFRVVLLEK